MMTDDLGISLCYVKYLLHVFSEIIIITEIMITYSKTLTTKDNLFEDSNY